MKAPNYMGRSTSECLYINPNAGEPSGEFWRFRIENGGSRMADKKGPRQEVGSLFDPKTGEHTFVITSVGANERVICQRIETTHKDGSHTSERIYGGRKLP